MTGIRIHALAALLAAVATATLATTASGAGSRVHTAAEDTLNIDIVAPNANFAPVFVAKSAGLFSKYGLNVNIIENTGANTLNMLVSGQADITLFSTSNPNILAGQGQPTTVFMNGLRDSGAALIGHQSITSLGQLQALGDNCHITTTAIGTQAYGYAYQYTHIAKLGLQKCRIESAPSNAVAVARLASGQVQAAVLPLPFAITFVNQIGAHILISPNKRGYRKSLGLPEFISSVYFGLTSTVEAKRPLIIRFIKAINDTNKLLVPKNLTQLTRYLQPFDSFKNVEFKTLRTSLQFIISYMGPGANYASAAAIKKRPNALTSNPGYIPAAAWNTSLQQIELWGLSNFDASTAAYQYKARVDMSYLAAALKK
jgi:ABC-type nitrate/sulfonate/bicarbonate transport system substrate-binding protein